MRTLRSTTQDTRRSGTIYVMVLFSSLIVASIGLASLQMVRLQSRAATSNIDFAEARTYARSAIDIAMLRIRNNPYWRRQFGNGNWVTNQAIGNGTFSIMASDPVDNDVTTGENHPVILTGIGFKGESRFKLSVRMEVGSRTGSCLEVSMCSGTDSTVNGAMLTSDQTVSANHKYEARGGSVVNADVEAGNSISGSTYSKSTVADSVLRQLPDPLHTLDYYLANGSEIQYTSLPTLDQAQIINPDFETDISSWYLIGGTALLQQSSAQAKRGLYSLLVKNRATASVVAAQNLSPGLLTTGNTYALSIPVFPSAACTAKGVLTLTSNGSGVQMFETPTFTLQKNESGVYTWVDLEADIKPTWSGTLTAATVSVWMSVNNDYYMDKVSLNDKTFPSNCYVIDRQLLSPQVNPYGSQVTNPQGIYIINCAGKDVILGRARIVGTLVFVDPGRNSAIQGPLVWEPALNNFPSLLCDDTIDITLDSNSSISEAAFGVNLNPPGTPYPYLGGTTNPTSADTYPTRMTGLMYAVKDFVFSNRPDISGVVIANNKIDVRATSLNVSYINTYLNDPPPGFDIGTVEMKVVPGTWNRSID